jgi:hypothetical protein
MEQELQGYRHGTMANAMFVGRMKMLRNLGTLGISQTGLMGKNPS